MNHRVSIQQERTMLNKMLWSDYRRAKKIHLGGGEKSAKQTMQRENSCSRAVDYLKDNDADFLEIGTFAGMICIPEYGRMSRGRCSGGSLELLDRLV